MRNLYQLDKYRVNLYGEKGDDTCGAFFLRYKGTPGTILRVIASAADGWDHVSVSRTDRCPTWQEMDYVKRMFFKDDEVAFQLHPAVADHINTHPYCLHLWRPTNATFPLPPVEMV